MQDFTWLEKRTLRSVDQLRLWGDNPRLDPEEKHISISDYTTDLITEPEEKKAFYNLVNSISSKGFIPSDPIVIWQNENNEKYYVAEGNRRVLVLKLLRNPDRAPRKIRSYLKKQAALIDRNSIEKIKVCVAPTFEDCEWYINQRHSLSSLQRSWSRLQQQRWIAELYDKYDRDIEKVISITGLDRSALARTLRILKIRDLVLVPSLFEKLDSEAQEKAKSHRIPMTILERWFEHPVIREKWGINLIDDDIEIVSNKDSFYNAYAVWLNLVIHRDEPDVPIQINTRTITTHLEEILEKLPTVSFETQDHVESSAEKENSTGEQTTSDDQGKEDSKTDENQKESDNKRPLNKNPDRNQLVVSSYQLKSSNYKLDALFREFKLLPVYRYRNSVAASLRVFLDLAITEYFFQEACIADVCDQCKKSSFQDVNLKQRLEYMKKNKLSSGTNAFKVVQKLLNPANTYSLDTLNNYIHGSDTHHTDKRFLNGFWDFLFPLFEEILEIKEI